MKKLLILLITVLLFVNKAVADDENDGGFGVKAGIGLTTMGFEKESAQRQKNRVKVGGFVSFGYEKRIGKVFALEMELGYSNKGAQRRSNYDILGNTGTMTTKFNLHAIEVPITAKFYIGDNFNLNFGPYVSYFFVGNIKTIKRPSDGTNEVTSENLYDNNNNPEDAQGDKLYRHFDVGANLGLEFVSDMGLGAGARFQKGFVDFTNKKFILDDEKWVTNTGIQIYLLFRM